MVGLSNVQASTMCCALQCAAVPTSSRLCSVLASGPGRWLPPLRVWALPTFRPNTSKLEAWAGWRAGVGLAGWGVGT